MSLIQGNEIHAVKRKPGRKPKLESILPPAPEQVAAEETDADNPMKEKQARRKSEIEGDIATQLAGDFFHYLNFGLDVLRDAFPQDPKMWLVSRYYPYGPQGALWIDIPQLGADLTSCEEKAKVLAKHKIRYFYLIPEEKNLEAIARFHDVMDHVTR